MKTNGTLLKARLLALILLTISVKGFSQPDYVFKNSSLISGTDLEVGASYRFPAVKSGVDAIVTINFISTDVKIVDFDDNRNGGFDEAFQPRIQARGKTAGYAEFKIDFVLAGTFTTLPMAEVPATSIDVDGSKSSNDSMMEFDEFMTPGAYVLDYDMIATELRFIYTRGSITGKNTNGLEKTLIDTMALEAMFTVVYPNITTMTVRIGLDNQLNGSTTRQRSVYFKRFFFPNSFLPVNNLRSFSGNRSKNAEVALNWTMNSQHHFISTSIEKSSNGTNFSTIAQVRVQAITTSTFIDNSNGNNSSYYRLKMTDNSGKISYSNVIYIRSESASGKINVFPSVVSSDYTNINYATDRAGAAKIALYDQAGRMMLTQDVNLSAGSNTFAINGLSRFNKGQYIVSVSGADFRFAQQIQISR